MEPKISVIIPVYNVQQYLELCLEDVINQTYSNIEIILIDDGSVDASGRICDAWCQKDKRIKAYHKENGGLSDARNLGLEFATGQWVAFIDSDDRVSPILLQTLYENAKRYNAEISICDPVHIFSNASYKYKIDGDIRVFDNMHAIEEMWYQTSFLFSAWAKLYKKSFFIEHKFKKGIIFEDVEVMHRIFEQANKIVYDSSQLYGYVHRENSITTKKFSMKDCGILDICEELICYAKDKGSELQKAAEAYYIVGGFRILLNAPREKKYENYVKKAKNGIKRYGQRALQNPKVRKKTKIGIVIYTYLPFALPIVYKMINRWK